MIGRGSLLALTLGRANAIHDLPPEIIRAGRRRATNELFDAFPILADRIPWRPIGRFPTPFEELPVPGSPARLFVKRDDLSGTGYGGNKVRKLEFLLAEAELANRRTLITLGGVGSNHALATAIHGGALGFDVDLVLYRQPPSAFVRANLGGFLAAGARLHYAGGTTRAFLAARRLFARRGRERADPYFIMVGGTSRLGCLGYVNAALELARQVDSGELPEPEIIFVALGTTGTAAGLLAGLKLTSLRSRVVAVRVADPIAANAAVLTFFANDVLRYLRSIDPAIPDSPIGLTDFDLLTDYLGQGYGHPTDEAVEAIRTAESDLLLETTYTGKTFAACLDYCRRVDRPTNILFWNTFSSTPPPASVSWDNLPVSLRPYITTSDPPS